MTVNDATVPRLERLLTEFHFNSVRGTGIVAQLLAGAGDSSRVSQS